MKKIVLPEHMEGRVRFSALKTLGLKSPAHLLAGCNEAPETAAVQRGTAVNSLVLGNGPRVIGFPGKVRNGKAWEEFASDNADAIILTRSDYEHAEGMAAAVKAHKTAMKALDGVREETLLWEFSGLPCRSTPDVWTPGFVTDLKCSFTSHPVHFMSHALRMVYHGQLSWYGEGIHRSQGLDYPQHHYIVCVEDKRPYPVTVFRLTEQTIEAGGKLWRIWLERLKVCAESGVWPGYTESVADIDLPQDAEIRYANEEES